MENNYTLNTVFEKYPSSFFLVRPIIRDNGCDDFTYVYVNPAFGLFVGKNVKEMVGRTFSEVFGRKGEQSWLDLFYETTSKKMVQYVENVTTVLNRKLSVEAFFVPPDMCGCIIRDYDVAADEYNLSYSDALQNKAYSDALTGAYNRFHLQANESKYADKNELGVAYFDMNNFREVNAIHGHSGGDKILCEFVQMLANYYYKANVYRLGGDEFMVITNTMPEQIFFNSCKSFKNTLDSNGNAAIGYQFYHHLSNIWDAVDECIALMLEHKKKMKTLKTNGCDET